MNEPNFGKILEQFLSMQEKQSLRIEALSEKTDEKIDALCDLVAKLTEARIEAKAVREFDTSRMERIEENQRDQGIHLKAISDTMILVNDRVNGNRNKWVQIGSTVFAIIASVVSAIIITRVI